MMPRRYIADAERVADMKNLSPKEAQKILEGMKVMIPVPKAAVTQQKRNVALDMAIKALSSSEIPNSSDLISRQDAIDAISTWDKFGVDERGRVVRWHEWLEPYVHLRDVVTAIANLPSAEPERKRGK